MSKFLVLPVAAAALLSACAALTGPAPVDNAALPEAVRAPAGTKQLAVHIVDDGKITYECREKADAKGSYAWVFVGPDAALKAGGKAVGKYYGPPATWLSDDGSKVTGKQLAVASNGAANIPLQLVEATSVGGEGLLKPVSHIQRLNTVGGIAPAKTCDAASKGAKEVVGYKADYVYYTR